MQLTSEHPFDTWARQVVAIMHQRNGKVQMTAFQLLELLWDYWSSGYQPADVASELLE